MLVAKIKTNKAIKKMKRVEFVWAQGLITEVVVLGDLGHCGNYTYSIYPFFFFFKI